jgi:hypothetical protein
MLGCLSKLCFGKFLNNPRRITKPGKEIDSGQDYTQSGTRPEGSPEQQSDKERELEGISGEMAIDAINKEAKIIDGFKQIETSRLYEILKEKGYRPIELPNLGNEA